MRTVDRRQFLIGSAIVAGSATLGGPAARAATTQSGAATPIPGGSADAVADTYYQALLKNTPVMESFWDPAIGAYSPINTSYIGIGGNAVLLKFGNYDPNVAGIDKATLYDHTVKTITYYAATSVFTGGTVWGKPLFWNATFVAYFGYAAFLLWDGLSSQTQQQVSQLLAATADYDAQVGTGDDGSGKTNGLSGGYQADTKVEEMGNRGMAFATALAYVPGNANAGNWKTWLDTWMSNMTGFPVGDKNNPTVVDGETVAQRNTAQNLWPGYITENHGSYSPIYHESAWVYPARNAVGFILTGQSLPDTLLAQPNGDGLYRTFRTLTSSAGISTHPMVADRFHLYGRDVLPLTGRYLLQGDAFAGRAEQMMAEKLIPYVDYPPAGGLTKFSGQPSYEPEARAEVGMAYLLHYSRAKLRGGSVTPVSEDEFFAASSGTYDWGPGVGLAAQQTPGATALSVTKPGFVKFAWLPGHDDWLFDPSGTNAFFAPSELTVESRNVHVYSGVRDGYDATATVLSATGGMGNGYLGFATLPDGSVFYATTGLGNPEGRISVFNLDMPGVPGLDGNRTFYGASQTLTLTPADAVTGPGNGGTDDLSFPAVSARYVRMLGLRPATQYGYSIYEFEVYGPASGANLAQGQPTTASSSDTYPPSFATDGDPTTRWAVATADRSVPGSWLEVDLGSVQAVDRVVIRWQAAYGASYLIQVSADGTTWTQATDVTGWTGTTIRGTWLNVDNRVGFAVQGSTNPIQVAPTGLALSAGPVSGSSQLAVRAVAGSSDETRATAGQPQPTTQVPALRTALIGNTLALLNLAGQPLTNSPVSLPARTDTLYDGKQTIDPSGQVTYQAVLAGITGQVLAPRFRVAVQGMHSGALEAEVLSSTRLRLTNTGSSAVTGTVTALAAGQSQSAAVPPGATQILTWEGTAYPVSDLARGRETYPNSPLPSGMTSPSYAVDGDSTTSWIPGPNGRMVVDLGDAVTVGTVQPIWQGPGPDPRWTVSVSDDGLSFTTAGQSMASKPATINRTTRYVALAINGDIGPSKGVAELRVAGPR